MGKKKNKQRKKKTKKKLIESRITKFKKKDKKINNVLYDINEDEIKALEKAMDGNYFYFNQDSLILYEKNILNNDNSDLDKYTVKIDKNFYDNISLDQINNIKKILTDIKSLNINSLNYDFIKKQNLIDTYINNNDFSNDSNDSLEESEESNEHNSKKDSDIEGIKEKEVFNEKLLI